MNKHNNIQKLNSHDARARAFFIVIATLASILPALGAPPATPVFGPKQYTRAPGAPQTFTDTFNQCGAAPSEIVVVNGNADGTKRISSASISLNGRQIVGPNDLNHGVARIVKPVVLGEQNQIRVRLASKPGSFLTVTVNRLASPVVLSPGGSGGTLLSPTTLSSSTRIRNTGTAPAQNVQVTAIALQDGTLLSPATLPLNLGGIPAAGSAVLDATFSGSFAPGGSYPITLQGTYAVGDATYCFTLTDNVIVPVAGPGSAVVTTITANANEVFGAPFPPQSRRIGLNPNTPFWSIPTGPFTPGTPTPVSTGAQMPPNAQTTPRTRLAPQKKAALGSGPGPIVFLENNSVGISGSTTAEPSGASSADGVVFVSANWSAAYSTDGGNTFTQINPTTVFPDDAVGFCCDQIVQYAPSIDRFIWLIQGNGYRLATASPADIRTSGGTAWTYWNLTPDIFGQTGFDYPDLSVGNNYLYLSWNAFGPSTGHQIVRTSLAGLQAGGTITIDFTDPALAVMAWFAHLCQNTYDEIFWAGHNNTSNMRVFSLAEGSNTYFWRDIGISTWSNTGYTSTTPDGQDWLTMLRNVGTWMAGSTRANNQVWFAWSAGTDRFFLQPHVQMVALDRNNNFRVNQQVQIWNNSYAFAYPALATCACNGEVGLSLEYGGNGNYENHVVGFWGDFVVYITTASNVGTSRYGDYVTLRQHPPTTANSGNLFSAFGYGINSVPPPGSGTMTDIRYILFGRPVSSCIIIE